ncbi:MAG: hypothetical protein KGH77_06230 [Candidatus Micrarchaeota archaeon]|nr:hypothetical protein [Candidatus Micrarchaeota archaeon]MDE1864990.1 hypothetical protein [Candidatus Micrarchaeota archaeon]
MKTSAMPEKIGELHNTKNETVKAYYHGKMDKREALGELDHLLKRVQEERAKTSNSYYEVRSKSLEVQLLGLIRDVEEDKIMPLKLSARLSHA